MAIELKHYVVANEAKLNPENQSFDLIGQFDSIIQPIFPIGMKQLAIYLVFEGLEEEETTFEMRVNSPEDHLISNGEMRIPRDPHGLGKKVIVIDKFVVAELGKYTIDILVKNSGKVKFLTTKTLFEASYPPQRIFREGEIEAILNSEEKIIKTIKTDFKPINAKEAVILSLSLDENEEVEEGHIKFPEDNKVTIEGHEYELTGLRREMEWMFGRPIPEEALKEMEKEGKE